MKLFRLALLTLVAALSSIAWGQEAQELVERWRERYREPSHVYEQLTLLTTAPRGAMNVVTLEAFARCDDAQCRYLWTVVTPPAARGMAVHAARGQDGALVGERRGGSSHAWIFGSVFTTADLVDPLPAGASFEYSATRVLDRIPHYVLRTRVSSGTEGESMERRIFLRKSDLWLSRIEDVDSAGSVLRRLQFKDPQPDDLGVLRPRMALLDDFRRGERTLLKVERRVHSADYVPEIAFTSKERRNEH